jgi:hypothetical protein
MTVMAGSNGILCKSMYKVNDIYSILNKTNKTNILVFSDLMIFTLPTLSTKTDVNVKSFLNLNYMFENLFTFRVPTLYRQ